ncbi:MAG: SpoIIE family protein phosphatase [Actinomycetota bacterium]
MQAGDQPPFTQRRSAIELRARATASFPPLITTPGQARAFVRETLATWGASEAVDDVLLLTTELVTNAVVHAGTTIDLFIEATDDLLIVSVSDRYAARSLPSVVAAPAETSEGGRGLLLVHAIALRWGVEHSTAGKRVWFEIPLDEPIELDLDDRPGGIAESDGVLVAAVTADATGLITHWSGDAQALLGWPETEMVAHPLDDLVMVDGGFTSLYERAAAHGRWHGTVRVRRPDGSNTAVFGSLEVAPSGGALHCLWTAADDRWLLAPAAAAIAATPTGVAGVLGLADSVTARLGLEDLLAQVLRRLCSALGGDAAYVLLADDAGGFALRAAYGFDVDERAILRARSTEGIAGRLSAHNLPLVLDDASGADADPLLTAHGLRSAVAAPLVVEGRMTGSLHVSARRTEAFTNNDAVRLAQVTDRVALAIESARLRDLEQRRRGWLAYVAEASELLAGTLDLDRTLSLVAQLIVPALGEWCGVHLLEDSGDALLAYAWHADEAQVDFVREALAELEAPERRTAAKPTPPSRRQPWRPPHAEVFAASDRVVYPLVARNNIFGSLTVGRDVSTPFRDEEIYVTADLVRRASLAIDNARLFRERVTVASALQSSLLPSGTPVVAGCELGVSYLAAGEGNDVGGDFYDVFPIGETRWGVAIGDVCGKGAEAAAVTGLARHVIRLLGRDGRSVVDVLERLNRAILEEGPRARFVTAGYAVVERVAGGAVVDLCSAGHPLPIMMRADGSVFAVGKPQTLLGVIEDPRLESQLIDVSAGDALVFFTDGVTERREGDRMLGEEGLMAMLRECTGLPAPAIAHRIERGVVDFQAEPPRDDIAIVVIKFL